MNSRMIFCCRCITELMSRECCFGFCNFLYFLLICALMIHFVFLTFLPPLFVHTLCSYAASHLIVAFPNRALTRILVWGNHQEKLWWSVVEQSDNLIQIGTSLCHFLLTAGEFVLPVLGSPMNTVNESFSGKPETLILRHLLHVEIHNVSKLAKGIIRHHIGEWEKLSQWRHRTSCRQGPGYKDYLLNINIHHSIPPYINMYRRWWRLILCKQYFGNVEATSSTPVGGCM